MAKANKTTEQPEEAVVPELTLDDLRNAIVLIKRSSMSGEEALPAAVLIQKLSLLIQQKEADGGNKGSSK